MASRRVSATELAGALLARQAAVDGPSGLGAEIKAGEVGIVPADVYASYDWSHGQFEIVSEKKGTP